MSLSARHWLACLPVLYMLGECYITASASAIVLDGANRHQAGGQSTFYQVPNETLDIRHQVATASQSPSSAPIADTVANSSPQASPTTPSLSGAEYITTLQTLIVTTSTLGIPGPSPVVQSSRSNETTTSSSSSTAAITSSAPIATPALPIQVTLDPSYGAAGAVFIISGIAMCFMGLRNRWTSYFLTGFYLVTICILLFILRFMPASNPSSKTKGLYLLAMFGAGILAGLLSMPLYYLSKYLVGALGGFSLAMTGESTSTTVHNSSTVLFLHDDGLIPASLFVLRIILIFVLMIFGSILSTFKSIHGHVVLGSTAMAGAFFFILGVDCFTSAGLKEFIVFLWGFSSLFPSDHFPFAQGMQIEVGVIIAMTLVGVVVQLKVWDAVQKQRKSIEPNVKSIRHDDEEAAAENLKAQLTTERDEWEKRHSNIGDRVASPAATKRSQDEGVRFSTEFPEFRRRSKRSTLESRKVSESINFLPKIDLGFDHSAVEPSAPAAMPRLSFEDKDQNGKNDAVQRAIDQYYDDIARIERNKTTNSSILDSFADTKFGSSSTSGIVFPKSRIVSEPEALRTEFKSFNLPRQAQGFEDLQAQRELAAERERNRRELDALKMEIQRLKQRNDVSAMDILQTLVVDLNRNGQGHPADDRGAVRDSRRREFSEPRGRSRRPHQLRSQSADLLERESLSSVFEDVRKPFIQLPANGKNDKTLPRRRNSGGPELSFFDVNAVRANLDRQRVLEQEVNMPERERLEREQAAEDVQVLPEHLIGRAVVSPTPRKLAERHSRLMRGLQSRAKGLHQSQGPAPSEHPLRRKAALPIRQRLNGESPGRHQDLCSSRMRRESEPVANVPKMGSGDWQDALNSPPARNQSSMGHHSRQSEADTQVRLNNRVRNWV